MLHHPSSTIDSDSYDDSYIEALIQTLIKQLSSTQRMESSKQILESSVNLSLILQNLIHLNEILTYHPSSRYILQSSSVFYNIVLKLVMTLTENEMMSNNSDIIVSHPCVTRAAMVDECTKILGRCGGRACEDVLPCLYYKLYYETLGKDVALVAKEIQEISRVSTSNYTLLTVRQLSLCNTDTGFKIYPAATIFSDFMFRNHVLFYKRNIIVLGAGCGLEALVSCFFCAKLLITDFNQQVLSNAIQNIENNIKYTSIKPYCSNDNDESGSKQRQVEYDIYDWTTPLPGAWIRPSSDSYNTLIACDCVYEMQHAHHLPLLFCSFLTPNYDYVVSNSTYVFIGREIYVGLSMTRFPDIAKVFLSTCMALKLTVELAHDCMTSVFDDYGVHVYRITLPRH